MLVAGRVGSVPAGLPPTLVYDGACGFCRRWVERVRRLDRRHHVRYLPLQDPEAVSRTGQPLEQLHRAVHFVRTDGAVFAGAAAVRELWANLPGRTVIRWCAAVPGVMPTAERAYAWIARRFGPVR